MTCSAVRSTRGCAAACPHSRVVLLIGSTPTHSLFFCAWSRRTREDKKDHLSSFTAFPFLPTTSLCASLASISQRGIVAAAVLDVHDDVVPSIQSTSFEGSFDRGLLHLQPDPLSIGESSSSSHGVRVAALYCSGNDLIMHSSEEGSNLAAKLSSRFRRFSDLQALILPNIATDVHNVRLKVFKYWSCKCGTQGYTHHDGESGCIPTKLHVAVRSSSIKGVLLVLRWPWYCSTSPESSVTRVDFSSSLFLTEFALWVTLADKNSRNIFPGSHES